VIEHAWWTGRAVDNRLNARRAGHRYLSCPLTTVRYKSLSRTEIEDDIIIGGRVNMPH
jgi:hypothetical protein